MSSIENQFDNKGKGDQNVAQGEGAVGKQENIDQGVDGDNSIFSGTGNVTVHQGLSLKPRTVVLAVVLLAGIGGGTFYLFAPGTKNSNSIGKNNSGIAIITKGDVTINNPKVAPELLAKYAEELGTTKQLINTFFGILQEQKVSRDQWDAKLRKIAATHKELLARLATVQSKDSEVVKLKQEAGKAIETEDYAKAEELLNQASALDLKAKTTKQRRISAAATNGDQAKLQEVQLHYAKAAEYWQKAAALLPKEEKKDRSLYLHNAAFDLDRIARYSEALPLYEQSLAIRQEIGDRAGEGTTLNNISQIYDARGEYDTALKYLDQSLAISREIGDRAGEGTTLSNMGAIHHAQGDYDKALPLFKESVAIFRETGSKSEEGTLLYKIGHIYNARGKYDTAVKYLNQSRSIFRETGAKLREGNTLSLISQTYQLQGKYDTAVKYLKQSLSIFREIGNKASEGTILDRISQIYESLAISAYAKDDYDTARKYLEQKLALFQEIGDRAREGTTLSNISHIYEVRGEYDTALKYLEQSLAISQEIGDRRQESITSWNIGLIYQDQGDLAKAEQYISRAVQLAEEIGHPSLEKYRKGLETVRAKIKGGKN